MTRKNTILMAALVNAVLLVTLFLSAIKGEKKISLANDVVEVQSITLPEPQKKIEPMAKNEIDEVLKEFSEKAVVKEEKKPTPIDFAKELEAITKATMSQKELSSKPTKEEKQVTVQKGDTLEKIARAHQVTVEEILSYNHLSTSLLQIGKVLKIPPSKGKGATPTFSETKYYTVKQGDNPWSIAVKNHLKLEELLKLNDLNEEKARRLRPGDKLRIQ